MALVTESVSEPAAVTAAQLEKLQGGQDFVVLRGRVDFAELLARVRPASIKDAR
jgi:hypothetical protein